MRYTPLRSRHEHEQVQCTALHTAHSKVQHPNPGRRCRLVKKSKKKAAKAKNATTATINRKNLANVRVIQRNLVYVIGLSLNICKDEVRPVFTPSKLLASPSELYASPGRHKRHPASSPSVRRRSPSPVSAERLLTVPRWRSRC